MSEFQRIERFTRPFRTTGPSVIAGPGDDCALTVARPGRVLVTKVDQLVENVHFTSAFRPEEIGHKALAVSLSDLAAAGAEPRWFLVALALPADFPDTSLSRMGKGMAALADEAGAILVGGNVTRASELSVSVTAIGEARRGHALRRSGARPGDLLLVSGTLGEAALGVRQLSRGRPRRLGPSARAQLTPTPRVRLGPVVGRYAAAAVDVSDGLVQDLGHLCSRSGVGAELDVEALPIDREVAALGEEGLRLALGGGEDYELLVAVRPAKAAALERAAARVGEKLTRIGRLVEGGRIRLLRGGVEVEAPERGGWDHFA